jgi:hypothetical protein
MVATYARPRLRDHERRKLKTESMEVRALLFLIDQLGDTFGAEPPELHRSPAPPYYGRPYRFRELPGRVPLTVGAADKRGRPDSARPIFEGAMIAFCWGDHYITAENRGCFLRIMDALELDPPRGEHDERALSKWVSQRRAAWAEFVTATAATGGTPPGQLSST